ncbi:hypothetical protein BLNAU_23803 [Blattamonas nauphoetae]|uniref:Uncharacterized protein n=1 Tax=Blattamonas nauphoetae TaxID=2049346 RepID=A0ABQ9WP70_9EUKA|nr:hypothetical protein BLNAU_23803 [Blattamonas nauphoetae]
MPLDQISAGINGRREMIVLATKEKKLVHESVCASSNHGWITTRAAHRFHTLNDVTYQTSVENRLLKPPASTLAAESLLRAIESTTDRASIFSDGKPKCPLCDQRLRHNHTGCCRSTHTIPTKRHIAIKHRLSHTLRHIEGIKTRFSSV